MLPCIPMTRFPWLLSFLFVGGVALFLVGCEGDYRPRAVGKEGRITVVMDSSHWTGPVGEAFREHVTPWVETLPQPERTFDLRHVELSSERTFESLRDLKNVVVAAPLDDNTNESTFLRRRLSDEAKQAVLGGQPAVVSKPNLWRRSQRIYFVTAGTADELTDAFRSQGDAMQATFREATLQRMEREMYEREQQYELEDSLMTRHGFAVNVQHDFQLAVDTARASTGFVWLRRILARTRREFLVYYEEDARPGDLTPEWIYETRDSLTREYLRGNVAGFMRIDYRRPLNTNQIDFLDRFGYQTHGLWHMVAAAEEENEFRSVGGGGPFVTYAFYDRASDRLYLLDGSVFAPGHDKMDLLRQMEVMARTFRTAAEQESDEAPVAAASQ